MTVSPFLNFTLSSRWYSNPQRAICLLRVAPPAGFEPARYGLESRCSILTELQGMRSRDRSLRISPRALCIIECQEDAYEEGLTLRSLRVVASSHDHQGAGREHLSPDRAHRRVVRRRQRAFQGACHLVQMAPQRRERKPHVSSSTFRPLSHCNCGIFGYHWPFFDAEHIKLDLARIRHDGAPIHLTRSGDAGEPTRYQPPVTDSARARVHP